MRSELGRSQNLKVSDQTKLQIVAEERFSLVHKTDTNQHNYRTSSSKTK